MAYKVIILYQLYMPSYFLGTFTEYPYIIEKSDLNDIKKASALQRTLIYFIEVTIILRG